MKRPTLYDSSKTASTKENDFRPGGKLAVIYGGNKYYGAALRHPKGIFSPLGIPTYYFSYSRIPASWPLMKCRWLIDCSYGLYGQVHQYATLLGAKVLGNSIHAAQLYDKVILKEFVRSIGGATPRYFEISTADSSFRELLRQLGGLLRPPYVVKPRTVDGLSKGIALVSNGSNHLEDAVNEALKIDSRVIIEEFVEGPEFCVGFQYLGNELMMLPPAAVRKTGKLLDHRSKSSGDFSFEFTDLGHGHGQHLLKIADTMAKAFHLVEPFYLNFILSNGEMFVFDCGTRVGLSQFSYYPLAMEREGLDWSRYICELFAGELNKELQH